MKKRMKNMYPTWAEMDAYDDGYCDAIEKAVEWLENNLPPAMVRSDCYMFNGKFIEDFRKAMKGGEE